MVAGPRDSAYSRDCTALRDGSKAQRFHQLLQCIDPQEALRDHTLMMPWQTIVQKSLGKAARRSSPRKRPRAVRCDALPSRARRWSEPSMRQGSSPEQRTVRAALPAATAAPRLAGARLGQHQPPAPTVLHFCLLSRRGRWAAELRGAHWHSGHA